MRKIFFIIWITFGILFAGWLIYSFQAQGVNQLVFKSSSTVEVIENDNLYYFTPKSTYQSGLIFYLGALVDTKAYAPLCRKIADSGNRVIKWLT